MKRNVHVRGSALLMAITLVSALSIGAAAVIRLTHISLRESGREAKTEVARQLAEAGIEKAVAMLRANTGYRGEEGTPLGAGRFSVTVRRDGAAYAISSTGETVFDDRVMRRASISARLTLDGAARVQSFSWSERNSGL